ncbi:hypothetical protein [uncultured Chitinophaga sp.]|uniref:hypothetical protein n=1 Tax=uncultured Chitinophaga sp. TaxID=339340 RepID=UPI0025F92EF4|nr:hypothetical protein [uncultured Chitinophaga sp.]
MQQAFSPLIVPPLRRTLQRLGGGGRGEGKENGAWKSRFDPLYCNAIVKKNSAISKKNAYIEILFVILLLIPTFASPVEGLFKTFSDLGVAFTRHVFTKLKRK